MAIVGTRSWLILGVVVVGAFSLVADDLNDWFHRRVTTEHLKTNRAAQTAEPASPQDRRADVGAAGVGAAGVPEQSSNVAAQDQAPAASGQDGDDQSAKRVSLAEQRAETPGRPLDRAPSETGRHEAAANVGSGVDAGAAHAAARTTDLAVQDRAAPADRQVAQADPSADTIRETQAGAVAHAPAEKPAIADAEQPADATAGAGASARSNDVASADKAATESRENSEPSRKDVTAQAPSQPLDQAPAEAPGRSAVANADAQAGGANADAAARSNDTASEQTASQSGQNSEPSQKDVTAQAPSQPLDQAPAEAPGRSAVANADAQAGGANADAAARSNDTASEQTASQSGQNSEPSQKDVTAQAPPQPLDQAPAEAPGRDAVANADAQAGGANADAAARSNDTASEQTASQSGQNSEPSQKDVTAQAPSQPLDQAPAEAPGRSAVNNADAQAGGANADAAARSNDTASEQTASQSGQNSEPSQKDVTAQAPSQPLDQAPGEAPGRDAVANADAQAAGANAKSNDKASEQTATLRGQHSEPTQSDVTAQAPSQPRDDATVAVAGRGQTGTDPRLQPEACGRLDGAQRQQCIDRLPQLGPHSGVLQAIGGERWVISETTSPVDYRPAVTASILLQSGASRLKLSIYCRRGRTDLELASDRPDTSAAGRDIVVTHSINRAAPIEQRWDARGSVAFFKGDVVAFLRSLPDDGELAVRVSDGTSVLHEGRFVLDGLRQVRDRFASACKWPEADDRAVAVAKSAEVAAAQQTSNLRSLRSEPAQKNVTAQPLRDAPSQPRGDAAVEVAGRPQTGTDALLQPEACGRLDDAQRQECLGQLSKSGTLKATGGDRWVITETTSPVDYSPMVTASILLQSGASRLKLSIICRRGRTHLELAIDRPDSAAAGSGRDIVVTHSINRDASIEQRWDARGSVASFRGDAVAFLRSLPDDGELAVRVSDGKSVLHEGRFVLDGLSHVRDRFASACKWPGAGAVPPSQAQSGMRKTSKKGNTQ